MENELRNIIFHGATSVFVLVCDDKMIMNHWGPWEGIICNFRDSNSMAVNRLKGELDID